MDGHTLRRNRDPAARQPALLAEWVRLLKDWTMSVQSVHAGEQGPICLISSLSHMLADGHTYYASIICSLRIQKSVLSTGSWSTLVLQKIKQLDWIRLSAVGSSAGKHGGKCQAVAPSTSLL